MKMQRRKLMVLWLVVLAASVSVGFAAEPAPKPHFVWIYEDCVIPEQMETYMKAHTAMAMLCAEHKFEFPFLTFVDQFRVYTCGIFGAFAQLDGFPQKMEAWNEKTGGKSKQLDKQSAKCVSHCSASISVYRPDLSYEPKEPAFTPDLSKPFYQMAVFYYIKPDKYERAQEAAQKVKQMHEQKQATLGYSMYEIICGEDVPALVVMMMAKDKMDFLKLNKSEEEKLGDDFVKLMKDYVDVITKTEIREGTFVPEASYVPEGTF
jgi:hypothetical protein